jgi:HAD superfamily hydrolase (TIGR01509 family)
MGVRETITALLFDFDGTIVDTSAIWTRMIRACFTARGFDLDDQMLSRLLSNPWRNVLPTLSESTERAIEHELIGLLREGYLECPPVPGLRMFLDQFADVPKAIVTSSYREQLVAPYLRLHGLDHYFPVVVGSEDTDHLKPSPEPVLLALRLLNAGRSGAWLIGDSLADMEAARSAGVGSVGFRNPAIGGDLVADSIQALAALLIAIGTEHKDCPQ